MSDVFLVFIGGGIGAVSRHFVGLFGRMVGAGIQASTLVINLIGCFLIGLVFSLAGRNIVSSNARLLVMTGFLGGFTTFSTYSLEAVASLRSGRIGTIIVVTLVANLGGFLCTAIGLLAGEHFLRGR